jgi:Zn-dependent protease with chaperone function
MKLSLRGPAALLASSIFVLSASNAAAGTPRATRAPRDEAFEQRISAELAAKTPEAVPLFRDANEAYDGGDGARAAELFGKVHGMAPWFTHATRRLCGAESMLGHRARALTLCGEALEQTGSAENEAAMAIVLASREGGQIASAPDLSAAKEHADRAAMLDRKSAFPEEARCQVALEGQDMEALRSCSKALEAVAPDAPSTFAFGVIRSLTEGDVDAARAVLTRARAHGMSAEQADALDDLIDANRPPLVRALSLLGRALGAWALLLVMMLSAGFALSRITLRTLARSPAGATGHPRGVEAGIRKAYRVVLWAASAYYYASIPLLVVVVLGATGGAIYGVLAAGWVAPKLFILLAIAAFGSISAIARSLFARGRDEDPGPRLDLTANPRVRALLDEVAARVGTRPVDEVFLTPFTDLAVFDRGGVLRSMRGARQRCLVLGAGILEGMTVRSFKSVLAHEYGHFQNDDTAGGGFALGVRRSLNLMALHLVRARAATAFNPAWWFVRGFGRAFLGISQGASRLQEVLADRWAAFAYGSADFERGLVHVIERGARFDAHLNATLGEVMPAKRALANLYTYMPDKPAAESDIRSAIDVALGREPSPYDSHPCPRERLALVRALASEGSPRTEEDDRDAWSLFDERPALERSMTHTVRERVRAIHGVSLPAADGAS